MRQKGFGIELPIRGNIYEVTGRSRKEDGSKLFDEDMTCFFSVEKFALSDKFQNKGKFAPRAWMLDERGDYWGWGSKSYAWPMSRDNWQRELKSAGYLGEELNPLTKLIDIDAPPRMRRNMKRDALRVFISRTREEMERAEEMLRQFEEWDQKEDAEKAEIDDLR